MFMRIRRMLREWYAGEREKLVGMSREKILQYIWTYYKLWIISIAAAVFVIAYLVILSVTSARGNWFYVCFGNVPPTAQLNDNGPTHKAFAEYAGYDLREKNLVFDDNCYCQPSVAPYGNTYYDKLIALTDSGVMDVLIMADADLVTLGEAGRLLDLQGEVYQIDDRWNDRLIFCEVSEEEYVKTRVPIAVDLRGSILTDGENAPYPNGCAAAVSAYAAHTDQFEVFLSFLLR